MSHWYFWPFWIVALAFSAFYALYAFDIHVFIGKREKGAPDPAAAFGCAHRFHQFWFNLVGSAVGWYALWRLVPRALADGHPFALSWGTAATTAVALLGITGHLPLTLYTFAAYGAEKLQAKASQ